MSLAPLEPELNGEPNRIHVVNDGKTITRLAGETVLETLQRHEYPIRVSCRNGVCQICEIRLIQGEVVQRYPELHAQCDANSDARLLYACTSKPVTNVEIEIIGLKRLGDNK